MPLYKTITIHADTQIFIWHITESLAELETSVQLNPFCQKKIANLKAIAQKKQFLSIRHLLKTAGYQDEDLYYDADGKPHLKGELYISVSHSHQFSAIIIGKGSVGIDIEKQREKILKVAPRFTPLEEYRSLANEEALIRKLTIVWSAKEAIYKILNIRGLSFLKDIYVEDFDFEDYQLRAEVQHQNRRFYFELNFIEFEDFTCVYALSSPPR